MQLRPRAEVFASAIGGESSRDVVAAHVWLGVEQKLITMDDGDGADIPWVMPSSRNRFPHGIFATEISAVRHPSDQFLLDAKPNVRSPTDVAAMIATMAEAKNFRRAGR